MKPWYSLENKIVWVFGGAGFLGSAITEALDGSCAKTLCLDLEQRAASFVQEAKLKNTIPISFDTSQIDHLEDAVIQLIEEHGLPDGVINLTYSSSGNKRLEELTAKDFQMPFDLSVTSFFLIARVLAERMKVRGSGSFVLFASMYGAVSPDPRIYAGFLTPNPIDYGASKAAILQMSRYLAVHYAPAGIRFNCITPGSFPNPKLQSDFPEFIEQLKNKAPMHRVGDNHEIVGPTLFLLTESASFVTGQSLAVDGGWTIW